MKIKLDKDEKITSSEERGLKWKELEVRITQYKFYLTSALQANVFYYVTTGGVVAYYLQYIKDNQQIIHHVEFFLLLPIMLGSVLGGIFIYGAWLQTRAVENIDDVRDELRNRLSLDIRKLHDIHLLVILLSIFGVIFFLVVVTLLLVPSLTENATLKESSKQLAFLSLTYSQLFYTVGIIILTAGIILPFLAVLMDKILKWHRDYNWLKTLLRADLWLGITKKDEREVKNNSQNEVENAKSEKFDVKQFKRQNFYYALRPFLNKDLIELINENNGEKKPFKREIINFKENLRCKLLLKEERAILNGLLYRLLRRIYGFLRKLIWRRKRKSKSRILFEKRMKNFWDDYEKGKNNQSQ